MVPTTPEASSRDRQLIPVPGGVLATTKLRPSREPLALVVINCAMSVKQSFYRPFAQFLASRGYTVVTWDYRGVGESVLDIREARRVSLEQWAIEDLGLVLSAAVSAEPGLPLLVIGHSFGGQIIALPDSRPSIRGALLIACPSGYVGHWRGRSKGAFMWSLAHLGLPVLTRIFGFFPAGKLRLGVDLPRRVALEWGGWLRHPLYIASSAKRAARIASFKIPIHAISFSDDDLAPPNAVNAMMSLYSGASVTTDVLTPQAFGMERIGHMGFFRPRPTNTLWNAAASGINSLIRAAAAAAARPPFEDPPA